MAEMPVPRAADHVLELFAADMDQLLVVAGLEIDIVLLQQAVVHDGLDPVGRTDRRYRAGIAVLEQPGQLAFGGEPEVALQLAVQLSQFQPVGMLMTHCFVAFSAAKLYLRSLSTMPMSGGSKSIMVSHDRVMTFALPFCAVVTSTTGPGSSRP